MDTRQTRYSFPAVRVCEKGLHFTATASPLFAKRFVKLYTLGDKLVFEPTDQKTQFEVGAERNGSSRRRMRNAFVVKHCGLAMGKAYRIYRMGTRYAVKLKEPLD